ncbi:MAG: PEP-CTERM sorting domain-containing protein [Isosphaeraceae bacterium]
MARAGYNAVLVGGALTFDAVNNNYIYTYSVTTTAPSEQVNPSNFIRFYDFNGYVSGSATAPAAGWTVSVAPFNGNPPSVILQHGDDAAVSNVTFTWNGGSPIVTANLGNFVLRSIYGAAPSTFKDFYGLSTNTGTTPATGIDTRLDYQAPVPEPASVVMVGIGIIVVGATIATQARRRARRV